MKFFNSLILLFLLAACDAEHIAGNEPVAKAGAVDFEMVSNRVLQPYCIRCHRSYSSYQVARASAQTMLDRVTSSNRRLVMPPFGAPLDKGLVEILRKWVEAGAPEKTTDEEPSGVDEPSAIPIGDAVSFAQIKAVVLKPHCMGCHTHYGDHQTVVRSIGPILAQIDSDKMPFPKEKGLTATPLPTDLKDILRKWVEQGMVSVPGFKNPALEPVQLEPTWLSLRNNLFGPRCIICHNSYGPRGKKFRMGTYKELLDYAATINQNLFKPKSPNDSHFIGAILSRIDDDEFYLEPMPSISKTDDVGDLPKVTEQELKVIEKWIELGLPYSEDELP